MKQVWRLAAACALGVGLAAAPATAATFQFYNPGAITPSANPTPTACTPGDVCGMTLVYDLGGGLSMDATAQITDGTTEAAPVLQDLVGNFGGLGVFGELEQEFDNISRREGYEEQLNLTFSAPVTLSGLTFFDRQHLTNFEGGTWDLWVDGAFAFSGPLMANPAGSWTGTSFLFGFADESAEDAYYVSAFDVATTEVPEPASLVLVGLGLLGAGLVRRRR